MLPNTDLVTENETLKARVQDLEALNNWYMQQLKLNRKKLFGASSESSRYDGIEQLNFFNEAETERKPFTEEPTSETITYQRKKGKRAANLKIFLLKLLNTHFRSQNRTALNAENLCM